MEEDNLSLYQCIIKKSISVTSNIFYAILWILFCFIIGASIISGGYLVYLGVTLNGPIVDIIFTAFMSIPWYVYVIIALILSILVYSTVWCVTRKFSCEDWNDFEYAGLFGMVFAILWVFIVILSLVTAKTHPMENMVACVISIIIIPIGYTLGAYLHYRKRISKY